MSQLEMIPGTTRDLTLSQHFTHPELAAKVVEWALQGQSRVAATALWRGQPLRVLEPSAGNGALVRPLVAAGAEVTAFELDARYTKELAALLDPEEVNGTAIVPADFLALADALGGSSAAWRFDLCVMNPPYEDGKDVEFILHALKFAPRVVGIFRADLWYGVERYDELWSQVRPTRILNLKRRWFKNPQTGKGGETNYVCLELVKRGVLDKASTRPDQVSMEWW
jgi:predicted RNA methylase